MTKTDVTVPAGEVTLAGTLTTPAGDGPHPAALIIAGSGPLDRDGNHKRLPLGLSKDLAEVLHRAGWATLRFDKRGIGESTGDYMSAGLFDELADSMAALEWLSSRRDVTCVVPVGHSAGSILAAEMSARGHAPAGAVLLAHTLSTGEETLVWQASQIGESLPRWVKSLLGVFGTSLEKQQSKALTKLKTTSEDVIRIQGQKVNAKWMREFLAYDPDPVLRATTAPILAVTGAKDVQVDPGDIALIATIIGERGQAVVIEDVDHILRTEANPISNPKKYKQQIAKPIDQRVVETVVTWLQKTTDTPR